MAVMKPTDVVSGVAHTFSDEVRDVDAANPGRQIDSGSNLGGLINSAAQKMNNSLNVPAPALDGPQVANGLAEK